MILSEDQARALQGWLRVFFHLKPPPAGSTVDDLVQEATARVLRCQVNGTPGLNQLRALALGVARNLAREGRRWHRSHGACQAPEQPAEPADDGHCGRLGWRAEQALQEARDHAQRRLEVLLGALDTRLLLLMRWDGYTLVEAQRLLGISHHQALAAQQRVRRFLSNLDRLRSLLLP